MVEKSSSSVKIYYPRYDREKVVALIKDRIPKLKKKLHLVELKLFGSYAKNRQTAASDVDILVVYEGRKLKDDYHIVWDILQIPEAQLHVYTLEEAEKLRFSGSAFIKEAESGITIYP